MKKKVFYIALMILCMSLITGSTWAYFTTGDTAHNVITSSGIDVTVVERQLVDGVLRPYPTGQAIQVMPTKTVSKVVTLRNDQEPAWVRMKYTLCVVDAEGKAMDVTAAELAEVVLISPDRVNWTEKDGWYYYNTALATAGSTEPLFTEVTFSGTKMDNRYQGCKLMIQITAQAVQQAHNGATVAEATGWPAA